MNDSLCKLRPEGSCAPSVGLSSDVPGWGGLPSLSITVRNGLIVHPKWCDFCKLPWYEDLSSKNSVFARVRSRDLSCNSNERLRLVVPNSYNGRMLMTRNADNLNRLPNKLNWGLSGIPRYDRVQFWLLVTASCLGLAVLVLTFPFGSVQADVVLSKPAVFLPPTPPVKVPSAILVEDHQAEQRVPKSLLRGVASWYGSEFHGRQTASGETYDMNAMTACHPTLPFGTLVRVINNRNHRSVVVRITDRGPFEGGRIIDLSYAAARELGMAGRGLAPVTLHVVAMRVPDEVRTGSSVRWSHCQSPVSRPPKYPSAQKAAPRLGSSRSQAWATRPVILWSPLSVVQLTAPNPEPWAR